MDIRSVLFVCKENSSHSQIAEAFARIHGDHHLQVYSAGFQPIDRIHPGAIQAMHEKCYDLTKHRCKSFQELPDLQYDFLVSIGCGELCTHIPASKREDWSLPSHEELPAESFNKLRDEIELRVFGLLNRLIASV
jgi:protein-tyrosine-phosphatase